MPEDMAITSSKSGAHRTKIVTEKMWADGQLSALDIDV